MKNLNLLAILLLVSILVVLFFLLLIVQNRRKKQLHYAVLGITVSLLVWNLATLLYLTLTPVPWLLGVWETLYFFSIISLSVATLFTGMIFAQTKITFTWKHALLLVIPVVSVFILLTNPYHHLFYTTFSLIPSQFVPGPYYLLHTAYSYLCIGGGLAYLGVFSVKNYGLFSKQALLIFVGILISFIVDSFSTFKLLDWSAAVENIVLAVTVICFLLAVVKFDFLNVIPIALQAVVDLLSDGYAVFDEDYEIIDFNVTFAANCPGVTRRARITRILRNNFPDFQEKLFIAQVDEAIRTGQKGSLEMQRPAGEDLFYYLMEIKPIFSKGSHIGTVILIKDVTEHKKNLEQVILLNAKLRSLATKDWLTQAYNRYFFDERLQREIDRSAGADAQQSFGLIMFDIDFFKIYNDNNGHQAGDELLQTIVTLVKDVLKPTDILCRYGGEEFAVICCQASPEGIRNTAESIRQTVADYKFKFQDRQPGGNLTVSLGAAVYSAACTNKDDLIKIADENLYQAKNNGKNQVVYS